MQEIVSGWGIWLETVEITDVKILSSSLFNNLQQPFRSSTRQTAEKIRIDTENDLQEKRVLTQFKLNKTRNAKDTEIAIERSKMKLKQEIQAKKQEVAEQQIRHQIGLRQLQNDFELKKISDQYAVDSKMGDINMKKQILT